MADTTNYGWTKPIDGGSSGAWGSLLNAALDDIDASLKTVEDGSDAIGDRVTTVEDENANFPIILPMNPGTDASSPAYTDYTQSDGLGIRDDTGGPLSVIYCIPIEGLRAGMQITGWRSRGQAPSGTTLTVGIEYVRDDSDGTASPGGAVLSHSTTKATLTRTGQAHNVIANARYYFLATMTRTNETLTPRLLWVQPTVVRV